MSEKELREKYGGKLPKAINRAIRAEIEGGNEALDKLTALAGPAMQSGWTSERGDPTPEAVEYFRHKRTVEKLEAQVRKTYGIAPMPEPDSSRLAPRKRLGKPGRKPPKKRS